MPITARNKKTRKKSKRLVILKHSLVVSLRNHYCKKLFSDMKSYRVKEEAQGRNLTQWAQSIQPKFPEFRSKTEWIGSFQPEKFRKKWSTFRGGPLFSVGPVRSEWTVPFDHSDPFSILGRRCSVSSVYKMEENTYHCTFMYRCYSYIHVQLPQACSMLLKQSVCFGC